MISTNTVPCFMHSYTILPFLSTRFINEYRHTGGVCACGDDIYE